MPIDLDEALEWARSRTTAVLITIRRDGTPQSSDVAFTVLDSELVVSVTDDRAKTANMRRDPRVVLHVTAPSAWSYVAFSGPARLSEVATAPDDATVDELVRYYEAVRGEPHPDWDDYRAAMVAERRLLVRIRPTRAVGQLQAE